MRQFGRDNVEIRNSEQLKASRATQPNFDINTDLISRIYGEKYTQSARNISLSLKKVELFEAARRTFPDAVFFLGENERPHFDLFCRVMNQKRRAALFVPLVPALKGGSRMASGSSQTAVLLKDSPQNISEKVVAATTSPRDVEDPQRFGDCQLQKSISHVITNEHLRSINQHCVSAKECSKCKQMWSRFLCEDFLVRFNQLAPITNNPVLFKEADIFRYELSQR